VDDLANGLTKQILGIIDPLIGPLLGTPKARGEPLPLDAVKKVLPIGKTSRAEGADGGVDGASESPEASTPPDSEFEGKPVFDTAPGGSDGDVGGVEGEGVSGSG